MTRITTPNIHAEPLFALVKSLSKAEKRNFKLYAGRGSGSRQLKFVQLFDAMDKQRSYDEASLLAKLPEIKKSQLSNLKGHLYKQILVSLKVMHKDHVYRQIREQLDFASILFDKGLYHQSLKLLDRARGLCQDHDQHILMLEVLEFEKLIESRHITRSAEARSEQLVEWSKEIRQDVLLEGSLADLALQMYALYLKVGHIRNEKDFLQIQAFFIQNLPSCEYSVLSFPQKAFFLQSHVWFYYITQDFPNCYKHAQRWVDLFDRDPVMRLQSADLYLKAVHNLLAALLNCNHQSKFRDVFTSLELFIEENRDAFNDNTRILAFLYLETNRINKFFLEGKFTLGVSEVPQIERELEFYKDRLDDHRIMIFYYKIACLYFGSGDFRSAKKYLTRIIQMRTSQLREDIQCFSRILNLIVHYELGDDDMIDHHLKGVYRFLIKMNDMQAVQREILKFLKESVYMNRSDMREPFIALLDRLKEARKEKYQARPFLYLDIISWLESKVEGRPVEAVIQGKLELNRVYGEQG